MRRPAKLLLATIPALLALGCASLGPFDSPELARALRARGIDPRSLVVPFEITDEMRAWVHKQVPDTTPATSRLDLLLAAMVDPNRLKLEYEPGHTATAREAFESRKANCLAFTSLFVGLARELGVPAFYLDVDDVERFEKDGDLMVVSGHVSGGYDAGGGRVKILDFTPSTQPGYHRIRALSDVRAVALYYSNRGAEMLRAGRGAEALTWLRRAVVIDPELGSAWVNLGVGLRRAGDVAGAEAAYRKALEVYPGAAAAYTNLAALLRARGHDSEAGDLLALATKADGRNPFSYIALGDLSLAHGRLAEARRFYQQALRLNRDDAEVYAALGMVALAGGDHGEARRWLRKAEARDRQNERVRQLGERIAAAGSKG
ncbi:MAG TPA: tetratricopeptide repeat protein [Thermoanaerobaculia bacterium]|nr:tetratricopeptide repeat protein [Thermoanaerobaculia bacterium]